MSLLFKIKVNAAVASLSALVVTGLAAQDKPFTPAIAPTGQTQQLERVEVIGSQNGDDRRESTASKIVVTREDIARFGDNTVADVLRRIAGVTIGGIQGRGGVIRMLGLGSGYTQILINGEPTAPGFSFDSLSPSLIERIEVLRVATADLSAQAIAGTINIILKQTVRQAQREIKASVAGYGDNPSAFLDGQMSDHEGALSYILAGGFSREKNTWPFLIEQRGQDALGNPNLTRTTAKTEYGQNNSFSFAPRLNWKLASGDTLSAETLFQYRRIDAGTLDKRITALGLPPLYAGNDLKIEIDSTLIRTKLNWIHNLANNAKLEAKLGANYNRRSSAAKFFGFDNFGGVVLDENTNSLATDESLSLSGKYTAPYAEDHAFAMGWDGEYSQRGENRIQRQSAPTGYPAVNLDEIYDARVSRLALFAQDEWEITPRWSTYLGLRWEGLQTRSAGNVLTEVRNQSSVLSPIFQTVWKLPETKNDQLRLGLSRTYKAPNTRSLMPRRYVANDNTATTPDLQGNSDLQPELSWGLDLAYEHYLGDAGLVSLSANARRIQDVILQQLSNVNGVWISSPVNNGAANVKGIEIETKVSLRKMGKTLPDLDIRANAARNWSFVQVIPEPNNRLDSQTPSSANLGMDYRASGMPLTIGGNFGFQEGGAVRLSENQSADSSSKRILDLYGLWKFSPKTQLRLTLTNVLRQENIAEASYLDSAGLLHQVTTTPTNAVLRVALEVKL